MPKFTSVKHEAAPRIESWEVEFSKEDWDEFHKGPKEFLKRITEAEGRPTDRILLDAEVSGVQGVEVAPNGDICHGVLSHHYIYVGGKSIAVYTCSGLWE